MSILWQLNYALFQKINMHAGVNPVLDGVMVFCAEWFIFCFPLLLLLVWGVPLAWRRRNLRPDETALLEERRAVVLWTILACILGYAFNLLIEVFVFEPRPFISHQVHVLVTHTPDSAFPSDHTAWAFAVVGMLAFTFLPRLFSARRRQEVASGNIAVLGLPILFTLLALTMACIIGFARIYVGVHYPDDILGGAFDGLLAAGIINIVRHWLQRITKAVLHFFSRLRLA